MAEAQTPEKPHLFQPGQSGNPRGKPKGAQNHLTRDMKDMLHEALQRAGENAQKRKKSLKDLSAGAAYLAEQAEKNPVAFMGLVRQLLPAKIDLDVTLTRDLVDTLASRRDQLARLKDVTPIEGETDD